MVGFVWRVEYLLDVFLKKEIGDFFLVLFFNRVVKFVFFWYKIVVVVGFY